MNSMGGRQTKGPDGVTALVLSEDLKRSAQALVHSYDALPWDDLKKYELTNVRLSFLQADGFRKAKELLLFIECSHPDLVRSVTEKFEDILSQQLVPVLEYASLVVAKSAAMEHQRKLGEKYLFAKQVCHTESCTIRARADARWTVRGGGRATHLTLRTLETVR